MFLYDVTFIDKKTGEIIAERRLDKMSFILKNYIDNVDHLNEIVVLVKPH